MIRLRNKCDPNILCIRIVDCGEKRADSPVGAGAGPAATVPRPRPCSTPSSARIRSGAQSRCAAPSLCGPALSLLAPGQRFPGAGHPDDVARAARSVGPYLDLVRFEAGLAKAARESGVGGRRPDRQHAAIAQCGMRCGKSGRIVEAVVLPGGSAPRGRCRHRAGSHRSGWPPAVSAHRRRLRELSRAGSSRLSPKISAIGPLAQATTAGTSSATVIEASASSSARAARSVNPIPSPPISSCAARRPWSRWHDSLASASSDPLSRLFMSSFEPSMIENSAPRCLSRSSCRCRVFSRNQAGARGSRLHFGVERIRQPSAVGPACPAVGTCGTADRNRPQAATRRELAANWRISLPRSSSATILAACSAATHLRSRWRFSFHLSATLSTSSA